MCVGNLMIAVLDAVSGRNGEVNIAGSVQWRLAFMTP